MGPDARIGGCCAFARGAGAGGSEGGGGAKEHVSSATDADDVDDHAAIDPLPLVLSLDVRVQPCALTPGVLQLNLTNRHINLISRITQHFESGRGDGGDGAAEGLDASIGTSAEHEAAAAERAPPDGAAASASSESASGAADKHESAKKARAARVATETVVKTGGGPMAVSATVLAPRVCVRIVRHVLCQAAVERWAAHRARQLDASLLRQQEPDAPRTPERPRRRRSSSSGRSTTRLIRVPVPKTISADGVVEIAVEDKGADDGGDDDAPEDDDAAAAERGVPWVASPEEWSVSTVLELSLDGVSLAVWLGLCGGQNGVAFRAVNADVALLLESAAVHWRDDDAGAAGEENFVKLLSWGRSASAATAAAASSSGGGSSGSGGGAAAAGGDGARLPRGGDAKDGASSGASPATRTARRRMQTMEGSIR